MKLTTKSRYALRAAAEMARSGAWVGNSTKAMRIATISKRQDISEHYMRQIAVALREAGIVVSRRGVGGGLLLAKTPKQISALDILTALDEDLNLVSCLIDKDACNRMKGCATRSLWIKLAAAVKKVLKKTSLEDLIKNASQDDELHLPFGYEFCI